MTAFECGFCLEGLTQTTDIKVKYGLSFHKKCLRKLRKVAKKEFQGNIKAAFKSRGG